ncbi:DoxX family protein [Rathayibacter rathayi]|uniref:DoxX family protein n=1 Tax=Rathayibacter rathayi TaxID=33887 RepID=UPI000CE807B5|nr:DoxX family protein [Rathayibacter rathayi]PPF80516.1 DoxX family protein [Rathayibacter rathayi]PPG44200.1 DoxX family protein [Rathayibacter rathayi]PPG88892.1 DoxX family protein [Rathayibacter rathayi]PPG97304.1 DoxX family protein [Rathayibacter rathayi]PPI63738.1 DoxX family protein [Rathayibacter rathayi]
MKVGSLILRLAVGGLFVGHGLQKLRGSFDGPGLDGTEQMMSSLELHPARRNAVAAAVTETAGGAALALGAATPLAAAGLIATMVTAVRKVHWSNGLWNTSGGWEYNGVLVAATAAIVADGPGALSFDALIGKKKWGAGWSLFALVGGAAASTALIEAGRRAAPVAASASSESKDGSGASAAEPGYAPAVQSEA